MRLIPNINLLLIYEFIDETNIFDNFQFKLKNNYFYKEPLN